MLPFCFSSNDIACRKYPLRPTFSSTNTWHKLIAAILSIRICLVPSLIDKREWVRKRKRGEGRVQNFTKILEILILFCYYYEITLFAEDKLWNMYDILLICLRRFFHRLGCYTYFSKKAAWVVRFFYYVCRYLIKW